MSRYIDAEKPFTLISRLMGCIPMTLLDEYEENGIDIVFCKGCKKHNTHRCHMAFDLVATNDDDFCSYGERREP